MVAKMAGPLYILALIKITKTRLISCNLHTLNDNIQLYMEASEPK